MFGITWSRILKKKKKTQQTRRYQNIPPHENGLVDQSYGLDGCHNVTFSFFYN